jgi:hypothetical protein
MSIRQTVGDVYKGMKLCIALLLTSALAAHASYDGSPEERADWIEFCAGQLKDHGANDRSVRKYCTCMSEIVDTSDKRRLYEWERMFPPAHAMCSKKANARWS